MSSFSAESEERKTGISGKGLKTETSRKRVGKLESAGYRYFLLFQQCVQKVSFPGSLTVWIVR